jgi:hypothetical protein
VQRWCDPEPTHGAWGPEENHVPVPLPVIVSVEYFQTCPSPYVNSTELRINEPLLVRANVTDSDVESVILMFRRLNEQWFNVSMVFNQTENLWSQVILGQRESCTMELFVEAFDSYGNGVAGSTYSVAVQPLLAGDLNGDGWVDMKDIRLVAKNFGLSGPP